jgi:site-specific DNA recombinase
MRAATYSRFSSDRQREASIDDQDRKTGQRIDAESWQLVSRFSDAAISGDTHERPGYQSMLRAAEAREFDVLVMDELSRIGRDGVERESVMRRLEFRGIRIVTLTDGYDSKLKARKTLRAIHNLKDELDLDHLRERTHRGLTGQALKAYSAGGKAYGYRPVPVHDLSRVDVHGAAAVLGYRREVHPEQAAIVREIFQRVDEGETLLAIASDLNARGIPSPGATWNRKTRRGDGRWLVSAVHAMLRNELYIGRYIWNRSEWIRDPDTRRRVRRIRPEAQWVVNELPELAIIDRAVWDRVQQGFNARAQAFRPGKTRRGGKAKFLLSGILECAVCGSKLIATGSTSRNFYRCGTNHHGGEHACANDRTVRRDLAEDLIIEPVRDEVLGPEAVEYVVRQMRRLWIDEQHAVVTDRAPEVARLDSEIQELERLVRAGVLSSAIAGAALEKAHKQRAAALRAQERIPISASSESLFQAERVYRETAGRLLEHLNRTDVDGARGLLKPLFGGSIPCRPSQMGRFLIAEVGLDLITLARGGAMDELVAGARSGSIHRFGDRLSHSVPLIRRRVA